MIEYYHNRGVEIPLVIKDRVVPEKNIFTILVGKNGTGKSTLLGNLSTDFNKEILIKNKNKQQELHFDENYPSDVFPFEIITVSTSPFDKFPLDRFNRQKHYTYLGLRDINTPSIGLGYLSKIIGSLIESIYKNPKQAYEICSVLEFLEYRDEIDIVLEFNLNPHQLEELIQDENLIQEFDNRTNPIYRKINRHFFTNSDNTINERKLIKLHKTAIELLKNSNYYRYFDLSIHKYGFDNYDIKLDIENLIFLFEAGIIRLKDVLLKTVKNNERFSIKDASSGEQSIFLSILGIASRIKDNCLILIDEPEICLHPHWQETYIGILTNTFDKYRNCQFIIATHSPLIISNLSRYNSFIVNLEDGQINSSENFINNSVDFQLANVFNNPGFKNEYLLRIAISTFAKVSKYKKFDNKDNANLDLLNAQLKYLKSQDPVLDLSKTLIQLKQMYG